MKLSALKPNDRNPRYIREPQFEATITSILLFPEMLEARGIVYARSKDKCLIQGGNQRFRAVMAIVELPKDQREERITKAVLNQKKLHPKINVKARTQYLSGLWNEISRRAEIPDNWVKDVSDWTQAQLDEFMIKDNVHTGTWDYDAMSSEADWSAEVLKFWGVDIPTWAGELPDVGHLYTPETEESTMAYVIKAQYKDEADYNTVKSKLDEYDDKDFSIALLRLCTSI